MSVVIEWFSGELKHDIEDATGAKVINELIGLIPTGNVIEIDTPYGRLKVDETKPGMRFELDLPDETVLDKATLGKVGEILSKVKL